MALLEDLFYRRAKSLTLFRKKTVYLNFEGIFLDTVPEDWPEFLYFNKINDDTCFEMATGKAFYRTENDSFFNEETGLYFYLRKFVEVPMDEFDRISNDKEYIKEVRSFLDYYVNLKNKDNAKKAKAECLMLKKGIKFRE